MVLKSRRRLRRLAAALLLVSATAGAQDATVATPLGGPIPVENLTPFALTRLDPGVPRPLQGRVGEWSFDTTLSYGNTFIMSDNVRRHLAARHDRRPLDASDVAALEASGEDYYYFDLNVSRITIEASTRLTPRLAAYVRLPVTRNSDGDGDAFIEGFHDLGGFDSAGRKLVARNQFQAIARVGDDRLTRLDPASGTHLGDPVLGLRYAAGDWLGWNWQWAVALKPSLMPTRFFVASGATDASLQIAARRPLAGGLLWLALDNTWVGNSELFPGYHREWIPAAQAVYERYLGRNTELLLQANASASTIDAGRSLSELSKTEYQLTVGLRRHTRRATYAFALTESVINADNASDLGVHFSVSWRFDGAPTFLSLVEPTRSD